jgi:pimeloyl-ACP methyl ester carboxylesterase
VETRGYATGPFGQIHYRTQGEGLPLVLLHQTPRSSLQFRAAAPILAAAGLRTIAVDTPGYGLSDPPQRQARIGDYVAALPALLDHLGLERASFAGHHTGSLLGGAFAAGHPERVERLVMHGAPLYTAEERNSRRAGFAGRHPPQTPKPDGSHWTDRWSYMQTVPGHEMGPEALHGAVMDYFANGSRYWEGHAAVFDYDFEPAVEAITCPVLLMSSVKDPLHASAARLRAARPDWAYAELEGGTEVVVERAADWCAPVVSFLND